MGKSNAVSSRRYNNNSNYYYDYDYCMGCTLLYSLHLFGSHQSSVVSSRSNTTVDALCQIMPPPSDDCGRNAFRRNLSLSAGQLNSDMNGVVLLDLDDDEEEEEEDDEKHRIRRGF
jgi:hypothetical protein